MCLWVEDAFWKYQLPQIGHDVIALRHTLLAFSIYHERIETIRDAGESSSSMYEMPYTNFYDFDHYNKALREVAKSIAEGHENEVTLMTCIMFIDLDLSWGNFATSVKHLHNGLKILNGWKQKLGGNFSAVEGSLEYTLIDLYDKHSFGSSSFEDPDPLIALESNPPAFTMFLGTAEAWESMDTLERYLMHLTRLWVIGVRGSEFDWKLNDYKIYIDR